ncbi:MAG: LysR family transcriptional regulator [Bdellovibrionales bacterium]
MSPFSKEFEFFLILAKTKNISKAAEVSGIRQSGLSKALQKVEKKWGRKLFSRSKKGIELTREGQQAYKIIFELKTNWDLFRRATENDNVLGSIKIGVHSSIAQNSFMIFYGNVMEQYPGLNLELIFDRSLTTIRKVIDAELDFGLVINPVRHPELVILKLRNEVACVWKSKKSSQESNLIYFNPEMINIYTYLRSYSALRQIPITDYVTIATIVRESNSVGIFPQSTAELIGGIISKKELTSANLCLIYRKDRSRNIAMQTVIKEMKSKFVV